MKYLLAHTITDLRSCIKVLGLIQLQRIRAGKRPLKSFCIPSFEAFRQVRADIGTGQVSRRKAYIDIHDDVYVLNTEIGWGTYDEPEDEVDQ